MQTPLRRALAALLVLAASPLAAQTPAAAPDPLLAERIAVPLPGGFPPFERSPSDTAADWLRYYRTRSGARVIMVGVADAPGSWGGDDAAGRERQFRAAIDAFTAAAVRPPTVTRHDDPEFLVATARAVMEPYRSNAVVRVFMPRTGAPRAVGVYVMQVIGRADPADEPEVRAFLDGVRVRVDDGRSAAPRAFREAGVEMELPAGIAVPREVRNVDLPDEVRGFYSRSGDRHLMVMVVENPERGASAWPPERRMRHMQRMLNRLLRGVEGEARLPAFDTPRGLAARDFPFAQIEPFGAVTGRGRMVTTQSGPHRMAIVLYYETDTGRVADEQAVLAMFDSVRLLPAAGR